MDPLVPASTPAEPLQRWRLTYRRDAGAPALPQREGAEAWATAFIASGLPLAGLDLPVPRPRLTFAAPLAVGMAADRELVDFHLIKVLPVADVRSRLQLNLPSGHVLVNLHDIWMGAPALSGQVIGAVYRVAVGAGGVPLEREAFATAARQLLGAASLPRTRDKSGRSVSYDLRPLLADIQVGDDAPGATTIMMRVHVRFDPERGVGRLDEVLAALSEVLGVPLVQVDASRELLILAGDA
ncbi:MAG: DUF2344 domain-containing protein [Chloroflexota bacterium]